MEKPLEVIIEKIDLQLSVNDVNQIISVLRKSCTMELAESIVNSIRAQMSEQIRKAAVNQGLIEEAGNKV